MRVVVDQVAEGLGEEDEARPRAGPGARAETGEQALDDVAQFPQQRAPGGEYRSQQARDGEHVLPVRHRGEYVGLHPLAVREHAFLMTARAGRPRPAVNARIPA